MNNKTMFISHTHSDRGIAEAIKQLATEVFDGKWKVAFSSDQSPNGGILPGEEWLPWILTQVVSANCTLVILTPESQSKPWVLWESGAVTGAVLGSKSGAHLVPVLFHLSIEEIPSPLRHKNVTFGEDPMNMRRLFEMLNRDLETPLGDRPFNLLWADATPRYTENVTTALEARPLKQTEDVIQEWMKRIADVRAAGRYAEIASIHDALKIAFSTPGQDTHPLIDARIHRELGEIYYESRRPKLAYEQFELALKRMPRDLYLLHKLGLAALEAGDLANAEKAIQRAEALSPESTKKNSELVGLKGRFYRERHKLLDDIQDLRLARDTYMQALQHLEDAYYLADNAGILSLQLKEAEIASKLFTQLIQILERTNERSIWSRASLVTARAAIGRLDDATSTVKELAAMKPKAAEIKSVVGGWSRLVSTGIIDLAQAREWERILLAS